MGLWDLLTSGSARPVHCTSGTGSRYAATPWPDVVRDAERMTAGLRAAGVAARDPGGDHAHQHAGGRPRRARHLAGRRLRGVAAAAGPGDVGARSTPTQLADTVRPAEPEALLLEQTVLRLLPEDLRRSRRPVLGVWSRAAVGCEPARPATTSSPSCSTPPAAPRCPRAACSPPGRSRAQMAIIHGMVPLEPAERGALLAAAVPRHGLLRLPAGAVDGGMDLFVSSPERFGMSPGQLARATWSRPARGSPVGTNTALAPGAPGWPAPAACPASSGCTRCIVGAERVEWDTLRRTMDALGPYGLRPRTLMPGVRDGRGHPRGAPARPKSEAPRLPGRRRCRAGRRCGARGGTRTTRARPGWSAAGRRSRPASGSAG